MLRWMFGWEEAAKRPWRTVITVSLSGLVAGGLYGYFRFGDSVGYGVALGSSVALILGTMTLKTVHDPARVAELTERKRARYRRLRLEAPPSDLLSRSSRSASPRQIGR